MNEPIFIEDADDPRIEPFRDVRERDLVGRSGFIAEGSVVLDQLLVSERFRPTALLILRNRLDGVRGRIAGLSTDTPVYVAERPVFDRIAGFPVNRGVLAHGAAAGTPSSAADILARAAATGRPVVVGVEIANHDNLGAIFRNAAAFGAAGILMDETSCHPLYRKALRVSVGTALTLPWYRGGNASALVAECEAAGCRVIALSPAGETPLARLGRASPTALLLGAEGRGLPPALMQRCETVRIEMQPEIDSLNVATAAAIVLHALYSAA
ncbi:RNA methyltransferase [Aurantimonas sp. HBX-1]|uniref:TrmH family RNA methyltransferase n=1 Tax=Aurantimonas sp. HBX-1 TaxID=2906072 RepID=UPI001F46BEFA|nr:RNA methyltransferase [Aurantimonas sp. HBX-1]UIJ70803.1 RNA methyltransferase [Aurantimonas sp. HBX-1]